MRYLYSLIWYLLTPFILIYLKYRGRKNPKYNLHWHERFGIHLKNSITKPIIWIHTVSVGETRAISKLVAILTNEYPAYQLLITNMTPTGRDTAQTLFPQAVVHYIPYDQPHAVLNFYRTFKPKLGLIMETEIWPNLIFYAKKLHIPLYLTNARLSKGSYRGYRKVSRLINPIINQFTGILCQDQNTATNFANLGYLGHIAVVGNTKFDTLADPKLLELAQHLKQQIPNKRVVAFASTRDGEEELILNNLPQEFDYLILIIPRHPERFEVVEELMKHKNLNYQKRSDNKPIEPDTQIFLGDSLGEMFGYYAMSDLAVMGGSFNPFGSQNLIEPLSLAKPVIFGPSTYNFATVTSNALQDKCAIQVKDMHECFVQIAHLLSTPTEYSQLAHNSQTFIQRYQGASRAIVDIIRTHL